jgi:glutamyl-tRNA(Gln) amidotransferase subunit E
MGGYWVLGTRYWGPGAGYHGCEIAVSANGAIYASLGRSPRRTARIQNSKGQRPALFRVRVHTNGGVIRAVGAEEKTKHRTASWGVAPGWYRSRRWRLIPSTNTQLPSTRRIFALTPMEDFLFPPFEEMTRAQYERVGFKSGLEVHQQLLTRRKLFCRCPAGLYSTDYHAEILRHMRPTLSELGEYDGTALMEFKTKKDIIYRINRESVCTYEMDDTPPFLIDDEALDSAIAIGLAADLTVVDEVHIARKQYLDGSIPTGFQRTAIVAVNGDIPYGDHSIGISHMSIEEDSCREISDAGHRRTYNADRLGMPLIEIVTMPDMKEPREVMEVANILRRLMRTTGRVRRGIGATRADTNVSCEGGTRNEIKGVPRIGLMPLLTYNECRRQWSLLRLRAELARRGITTQTFASEWKDVTRSVRRSRFTPIAAAIGRGECVAAVKLSGWASLLCWDTQMGTTFSREIADRVRVIACLSILPNIIHSDSPSDTISGGEWSDVKRQLSATPDDTVVIVWGEQRDVDTAVKEIAIRAKEATVGVPNETRQPLRDGTTGFERILPGPQRMYPDTDLPPIRVTQERVAAIRATLPIPLWEREAQFRAIRIEKDSISGLAISPLAVLVDDAVKLKLAPARISEILYRMPRRLCREGFALTRYALDDVRAILAAHAAGTIAREGLLSALRHAARGTFRANDLPEPIDPRMLDVYITAARDRVLTRPMHSVENINVLTMDAVMDDVRGRVAGNVVWGEVAGR